jgi:hypothetical protein
MKRRLAGVLLCVIGALLVIPQIWSATKTSLRPGDVKIAFTPLYRIRLEDLDSGATFSVAIPNNEAWRRIRRAWGDPGYVIAPVSPDLETMYCLDTLGIEVQATVDGQPLPTQMASSPPYGFSTSCSSPVGVKFNATPSSRVEIRIDKRKNDLASSGDLLVTSYWVDGTKDKLVGIALDQDLRVPFLLMSAVGILCLGGGGLFLLLAPASNSFPRSNYDPK